MSSFLFELLPTEKSYTIPFKEICSSFVKPLVITHFKFVNPCFKVTSITIVF